LQESASTGKKTVESTGDDHFPIELKELAKLSIH
jgi:hypothetical protein